MRARIAATVMSASHLLSAALLLAVAAPPTRAEAKTIIGRCLAVVDGKTRVDSSCEIVLEVGGGFAFQPIIDAFHVVPDKATGSATATWTAYGNRPGETTRTRTLGPLTREGACWTHAQARICAWNGAAEARRNRDAPYTAFHALVGKDIEARCHMGECEWFRFESAKLVAHNAREAIYELGLHSWAIEYDDDDRTGPGRRRDDDAGVMVVRCSKTRPASIGCGANDCTVYGFAPAAEFSGAAEVVDTQYVAACHAGTRRLFHEDAVLLGYRPDVTEDQDEPETIVRLADALDHRAEIPGALDIDWGDDHRGIDVGPILKAPRIEQVRALRVRFGRDGSSEEIPMSTLRADPRVHLPSGTGLVSLRLIYADGTVGPRRDFSR